MKILLTGSSGFLGEMILNVLDKHEIVTLSQSNADIKIDLSKQIPLLPNVSMVIHSAGKAHSVPRNSAEDKIFFEVNVTGTANLLKGLENAHLPRSFVFISTVAVYGKETGILINEEAPLLAKDPYGKSKIEAEQLVTAWCKQNNVICTILRLPLVAGINPPGNLNAMIKGIKKGYYFNIGGGTAKKSMVMAKDVAAFIPVAAKYGGIYNLTDGYHPSLFELSKLIARQTNKKKVFNLPLPVAKLAALAGDMAGSKFPINSSKLKKLISPLTFDDTKARNTFGWNPTPVLAGFEV
jgi:nucleoside-diphosphate-sugar epimerase